MAEYLFHGSITPNIKILKPQKRYTPGALGKNVPAAVYAGDDAFYCIGHAIPWSSDEGFNIGFDDTNTCIFTVPKDKKELLNQKVYLYTVPKDKFILLPTVSPKGHNFWSLEHVEILKVVEFNNVEEAANILGGKISYI